MHLSEDELVLHYYGEMSEAAEARACAHLDLCGECRRQLARLQRVMTAIDRAPMPDPGPLFEQEVWSRLQRSLARRPRRDGWLWSVVPTRPALAALGMAAAAAVLLIATFVAGRFWPAAPPTSAPVTSEAQRPARERVLLVDLGDHLDRSELALVEFVNGSGGREAAAGRSRAEDLVAANRLYRRTALATGDRGVADMLEELERVLIEIAGTSPDSAPADLAAVRRRIDTRDLLFKLRVMRTELQDRVKDTDQTKDRTTL